MRATEFRIAKRCSREAKRECTRSHKRWRASRLLLSGAVLLLLPACSVNVRKEGNGQDKQVDIKTLLGGIHVSKMRTSPIPALPSIPVLTSRRKIPATARVPTSTSLASVTG